MWELTAGSELIRVRPCLYLVQRYTWMGNGYTRMPCLVSFSWLTKAFSLGLLNLWERGKTSKQAKRMPWCTDSQPFFVRVMTSRTHARTHSLVCSGCGGGVSVPSSPLVGAYGPSVLPHGPAHTHAGPNACTLRGVHRGVDSHRTLTVGVPQHDGRAGAGWRLSLCVWFVDVRMHVCECGVCVYLCVWFYLCNEKLLCVHKLCVCGFICAMKSWYVCMDYTCVVLSVQWKAVMCT